MLRDFARKLLTDAAKLDSSTTTPIGTLSDISQFPVPLYGEVNGTPVTLLADANMRGFSPVTKCVDADHEVAWIPTEQILLTDPRMQPAFGTTGITRGRKATPATKA